MIIDLTDYEYKEMIENNIRDDQSSGAPSRAEIKKLLETVATVEHVLLQELCD